MRRRRNKISRRLVATVIVASLIVLAAVVAILTLSGVVFPSSSAQAASRAVNYLAANYNRSIGMIPEVSKGNTYFVYSDNFLAAYVLGKFGNSTVRAMAANITSTDDRYLAMVGHPENQYQVITSGNGAFFASSNYVVAHVGSAVIETTQNNGTTALSPKNYSDIAFVEALYWHQQRNANYSVINFNLGSRLYDGRGIVDQTTTGGEYQTYKLALYDYVGKILGRAVPAGVEADLVRLQAPDGGFYTGYYYDLATGGTTTNTETTSLAILALSTQNAQSGLSALGLVPFGTAVELLVALESSGRSSGRIRMS